MCCGHKRRLEGLTLGHPVTGPLPEQKLPTAGPPPLCHNGAKSAGAFAGTEIHFQDRAPRNLGNLLVTCAGVWRKDTLLLTGG